jgi:hypothetical protein
MAIAQEASTIILIPGTTMEPPAEIRFCDGHADWIRGGPNYILFYEKTEDENRSGA